MPYLVNFHCAGFVINNRTHTHTHTHLCNGLSVIIAVYVCFEAKPYPNPPVEQVLINVTQALNLGCLFCYYYYYYYYYCIVSSSDKCNWGGGGVTWQIWYMQTNPFSLS